VSYYNFVLLKRPNAFFLLPAGPTGWRLCWGHQWWTLSFRR